MANGTLKVQNIETSSGSDTITLGQSGETITVPTGASVTGLISNRPAFSAKTSTSQRNLTSNAATKINYDTVEYNVGVTYDTTNKRFTVPTGYAGKYFFSATARLEDNGDNAAFSKIGIFIYKNGSNALQRLLEMSTAEIQAYNNRINVNGFLDLAVGDYIEVYGLIYNTAWDVETEATNKFQGYRLIGV